MNCKIIYILSICCTNICYAQSSRAWVSLYDAEKELTGYKDLKGNIKIPAKFNSPTQADTFYNIIAVNELLADSSFDLYYLLKDGRKVGRDSMYMFDFTFDCEQEGKILFQDKKKNRVGFFDKNGNVAIPAMYNYALPFHNGLTIARRNAKRKCLEGKDTLHCEHVGWDGGETILINESNEVLADSVDTDLNSINWYSFKINDTNIDTSTSVIIKGNNGNTYSFTDYEKEFTQWFYSGFLPAINSSDNNKLKQLLFQKVTYMERGKSRTSISRNMFLQSFPAVITRERFRLNETKELYISRDDLSGLIVEQKEYRQFFNSCGGHNAAVYPVFSVLLEYYKKRAKPLAPESPVSAGAVDISKYETDHQESFDFIRTEQGYKLLSISL
ncbi:WG repeat-containing protein [Ferruginibacter sp. SUN106]|uniref:WG repeat-containing protein n=1 Tax=Ferruginibacter sp. SUN106 TaxID=2978348 RepID=UPI003D35E7EA